MASKNALKKQIELLEETVTAQRDEVDRALTRARLAEAKLDRIRQIAEEAITQQRRPGAIYGDFPRPVGSVGYANGGFLQGG